MVIFFGSCNRYLTNQMIVLITINLYETLWHITATKKMQDYSPSLSAEMKGPVQIFLYKNQFYKHKNNIKKNLITCGMNSWLWDKVPTSHNFLFLFFLYMILVNIFLQLDTTSVVIFLAHQFSLPFTFLLAAKDFDLPSSGGYLTNNVK